MPKLPRVAATLPQMARAIALGGLVWLGATSAVDAASLPYLDQIQTAEAQLSANQFTRAAATAQSAYAQATTESERLRAARLASAAQFRAGRPVQAQLWLRRAANHVSTADDARLLQQDFARVKQDSPFAVNLSFSIAPSDNINGGAADRFFMLGDFLFEFAPSALALSGVEYTGQADLTYTLSESASHKTTLGVFAYGRTYSLSGSAKRAAPTVRGSDYALTQIEATLGHRRNLFDGLGPTGVTASIGKTWYGGEALRDFWRIGASQDFILGQNAAMTISGFAEDQRSLSAAQPEAQIYNLQGTYAQRLANQDIVRVTLQSRYQDTVDPTFTFSDSRLFVDYERAERIWNTKLSFSLGFGYKNYDTFSLSLNGRRDRSVSLGAKAVFENLSYYAFSPSLSVTATQTRSNVARFTSDGIQVRLGFESNF